MPKSKEELTELKEEFEALTNKLKKLSDDDLKQVIGGMKAIYNDSDPEELSFWEKLLKIFNKIGG